MPPRRPAKAAPAPEPTPAPTPREEALRALRERREELERAIAAADLRVFRHETEFLRCAAQANLGWDVLGPSAWAAKGSAQPSQSQASSGPPPSKGRRLEGGTPSVAEGPEGIAVPLPVRIFTLSSATALASVEAQGVKLL